MNEKALKQYDVNTYRTPDGYTSDIAVFSINEEVNSSVIDLKIILIQRSMFDSEERPNIEAGKWGISNE